VARLLYRLGRLAARRAWLVIVAWVVVLGVGVGSVLAFGGTLSSAITIPGTETTRVTDRLAEVLPDASGGTASIVFRTDDDAPFTADQRDDIAGVLDDIADDAGVTATVNPFTTEDDRAAQAQQLADGRTQVEQARTQLDAGQQQLDAGRAQLEAAVEQARAAGVLDQAQAQFDAQTAELDAQQQQLDASRDELETQAAQVEAGAQLLDTAAGIRSVSEDGATAIGTIVFDEPTQEVTEEVKDPIRVLLTDTDIPGVTIDYSTELAGLGDIVGAAEIIGVAVAAIVLLVMLGTLVAAGLPILNALLGVAVSAVAVLSFSSVVDMVSVTPVLGVMLGLAVGIDYSLFIINRHRNQLRSGMDLDESIGVATGTSGTAVLFAGATVLIALAALGITGIPFLAVMGVAGAAAILIAVLVALTMTPALLRLVGRRVLPRRAWARAERGEQPSAEVKPMSTLRAVITVVAGVAALVVVALPVLDLRLGLPDASTAAADSTEYRTFAAIEEDFGAGRNSPIVVVADLPAGLDDAGVLEEQAAIAGQLVDIDDVVAVAPAGVSDDSRVAVFQLLPEGGPSSESTEVLVQELRAASPLDGGIDISVAGTATANIDVSEKLGAALPGYLGVVVGLSLIILIMVFRSLLVPVIATAGFILSLAAAFGGITAIYQFGWLGELFGVTRAGPVLSFLPVIIIGVLFGLAMDYQLFLATGMREAWAHGAPARLAVVQGVRAGRSVVIAAAIIMISVFAGFMFSHLALIRPLGFGLAFGVLVDAFVVRLLIVPALMHLVGGAAWWLPRWLHRILPDVDVEGASLQREHPAMAAALPGASVAPSHGRHTASIPIVGSAVSAGGAGGTDSGGAAAGRAGSGGDGAHTDSAHADGAGGSDGTAHGRHAAPVPADGRAPTHGRRSAKR